MLHILAFCGVVGDDDNAATMPKADSEEIHLAVACGASCPSGKEVNTSALPVPTSISRQR